MVKYLATFKCSLINSLQYRGEFILGLFSISASLIITIFFSKAFYENTDSIYGYTLSEFATYTLTSSFIRTIIETNINWHLSENIRSGELSDMIIKPINFNLQQLFSELAWKVNHLLYNLLAFIFIFFIYKLNFEITIIENRIPVFIGAVFISFFLNRSFKQILGNIAFWMKDIGGLSQFVNEVIGLLGGSWIPLDFFKSIFNALKILPFSYIIYFPARLLIDPTIDSESIYQIFILQILWSLLFTTIAHILWKRGIKRYESVGI